MNPVSTLPALWLRRVPVGAAALLAALGVLLLLTGCGGDSTTPAAPAPAPAPPPPPPPPPEPETASYTFGQPEVRISPRIPGTLPEGVDFAGPLALVAHERDAAPFALGETATDGLKLLAEAGDSAGLIAEAEAASMDVIASSFAQLLGIFLSPDPSVELNLARPCLTYAQKIQPSSDWFIGFSNVCATDEDGSWVDAMSGELIAFDAGTAAGTEFSEKTGDTDPREPIAHLDVEPYFVAPAVVQVLSATRKEE